MITVVCENCGKNIKVYPYYKNRKYCSMNCRNIAYKGKHFSPNTEFKKGQKFSKERNEKIRRAHTGMQKPWLHGKRDYRKTCKVCGRQFLNKQQSRTICDDPRCQAEKVKLRRIDPITEMIRRYKLSKALKGRMPKNIQRLIHLQDSPPQCKLYEMILNYYPTAKYNCYVKTGKRGRYLDIAIEELMLDIEYNGKCHLLKSVKEKDEIRTRELEQLGWTVLVFDRNTVDMAEGIMEKIKENGDLEGFE